MGRNYQGAWFATSLVAFSGIILPHKVECKMWMNVGAFGIKKKSIPLYHCLLYHTNILFGLKCLQKVFRGTFCTFQSDLLLLSTVTRLNEGAVGGGLRYIKVGSIWTWWLCSDAYKNVNIFWRLKGTGVGLLIGRGLELPSYPLVTPLHFEWTECNRYFSSTTTTHLMDKSKWNSSIVKAQ